MRFVHTSSSLFSWMYSHSSVDRSSKILTRTGCFQFILSKMEKFIHWIASHWCCRFSEISCKRILVVFVHILASTPYMPVVPPTAKWIWIENHQNLVHTYTYIYIYIYMGETSRYIKVTRLKHLCLRICFVAHQSLEK